MLKCDFHMHTNLIQKNEGNYSPHVLVDALVRQKFDVAAITEHASIRLGGKLRQFPQALKTYHSIKAYAKRKGLLLLPGFEKHIEGKEVVVLNYLGDLTRINTFADLERIKADGAFFFAPHPFYYLPTNLGDTLLNHLDLIDAIEYSHYYTSFFNPNRKAVQVATHFRKPLLGNSDAHRLVQLGTTFSFVDAERTPETILEAIRRHRLRIAPRPLPLPLFARLTSMLVYGKLKKILGVV